MLGLSTRCLPLFAGLAALGLAPALMGADIVPNEIQQPGKSDQFV